MDIVSSDSPQGKPHYVYTLAYPESMGGHIFYIGKGMRKRIYAHEYEARKGVKSHKCNAIRKIWNAGEKPVKEKVAHFATHDEALLYEIALIFFMRPYGNLTNLSDGGDGAVGIVPSEETRRKLSEKNTGKTISSKGKPKPPRTPEHQRKLADSRRGTHPTEETRQKLRDSHKGPRPARRGKKWSEETLQRARKTRKKLPPLTEEQRRKIGNSQRGMRKKPCSEARKLKISESLKRYNAERKLHGNSLNLGLWDSA